jgi:hypothetical protein
VQVTANGAFAFTQPVATGAPYLVTVGTQPAGQDCTVSQGSGAMPAHDVTDVRVDCAIVAVGADLQIGLTASATQVQTDAAIAFNAVTTNAGPGDAQEVSLTIDLRPAFRYASHGAGSGATCTSPAVGASGVVACTWSAATAAGTSRSMQVIASSATVGTADVSASTTSATPDPVADNNAQVQTVQVEGDPGATTTLAVPALGLRGLLLAGLLLGVLGGATVRRRLE